jgi:hypothetical protein
LAVYGGDCGLQKLHRCTWPGLTGKSLYGALYPACHSTEQPCFSATFKKGYRFVLQLTKYPTCIIYTSDWKKKTVLKLNGE